VWYAQTIMRRTLAVAYTLIALLIVLPFSFLPLIMGAESVASGPLFYKLLYYLFYLLPILVVASIGYVWKYLAQGKEQDGKLPLAIRAIIGLVVVFVVLYGLGYGAAWGKVLFEKSGLITWVHPLFSEEYSDSQLYSAAFNNGDRGTCDKIKDSTLKARCYMNTNATDMSASDCLAENHRDGSQPLTTGERSCITTFIYQKALTDALLDCTVPVLKEYQKVCTELQSFQELRIKNSSSACSSLLKSGHLDRSTTEKFIACLDREES